MSKTLVTTLVLIAVSLVASRDARGIQLDNARVIVPGGVASAGDGCIGSFTYDQASDTFYTVIFGSDYGMRSITNADGQWVGGWESHMDVWATDFALYMVSDDVPAGKAQFYEEGPNDYIPIAVVYSTPSAILLNPVPLTIDQVVTGPDGEPVVDELGNYVTQPITYQPGELAYIIDHAKEAYIHGERRYDVTKKMYRWDLRAIDEPTSVQPDFGNAEDGGYGTWSGEVGCADWNDIFTTVFTEQDFRDAASAQGGDGNCTHDNIGRQFAWSSDGLSIYFMESSTGMGGLWKVDAITGDLQWLHKEINVEHTYDNAYGEPTLVHTSTFDYTSGQYTGDQIFFDGSPANGNDSGISYVVHDGTNTSSAQVLLDGSEFVEWIEWAEWSNLLEFPSQPAIASLTSDSEGNLYFYSTQSYSIYARDTEGRLACIFNKPMLLEVCETNDGYRIQYGGMLRLQTLEKEDGSKSILYRGDNSYIGEIDIPVLGDLTGDGLVDIADCNFMIEQYKNSCYNTIPTIFGNDEWDGEEAYLDYISADMNGSGVPTSSGSLQNVAVTFKDVETLAQFIEGGLLSGDLNWDGIIDEEDWSIFNLNYGQEPESGVWSWFDGDIDLDGDIDDDDRALIANTNDYIPGDANHDGKVDGSDVTILAGNWQVGVSDNKAATWEMGDFNGDGKVDGSDVTILAGNWQYDAATSVAAVPEPDTIVLLLLVGLAILVVQGNKMIIGGSRWI